MIIRLNHTSPLKVHQGSENSNMLGLALGVRDFSNHLILKKEQLEPKISRQFLGRLLCSKNVTPKFRAQPQTARRSCCPETMKWNFDTSRPWHKRFSRTSGRKAWFHHQQKPRETAVANSESWRSHFTIINKHENIPKKKHSPHCHRQVRCYLRAILAISVTNICSGITRH